VTLSILNTRKVVVVGWTTEGDGDEVIKGSEATLEVDGEEKRTIKNNGEGDLFFPNNFAGSINVTVRGSHSGEDTASLAIE